MKLLALTQKLDINDDLLGFFHGWVVALAKQCDKIIVVALGLGQYNLPVNVRVLSLGKERGRSKLKYLVNFYKYLWLERKNYDQVFVHMNQEYVLLGGLFWRLLGKKIFLWRNHQFGGWQARLALALAHRVFCTSQFAFVARYEKTVLMPVGVDTELFRAGQAAEKKPGSILFFGRISPVKQLDVFIEALSLLKNEGVNFSASVVGDAPPRDKSYAEKISQKIKDNNLGQIIVIKKGVPNPQAPAVFNAHEIFVNLTPSGSLDKTIFEAMACGCLALMANRSLVGQVDRRLFFEEKSARDLAVKLKSLLALSQEEKQAIIEESKKFVMAKHSRDVLIEKLLEEF